MTIQGPFGRRRPSGGTVSSSTSHPAAAERRRCGTGGQCDPDAGVARFGRLCRDRPARTWRAHRLQDVPRLLGRLRRRERVAAALAAGGDRPPVPVALLRLSRPPPWGGPCRRCRAAGGVGDRPARPHRARSAPCGRHRPLAGHRGGRARRPVRPGGRPNRTPRCGAPPRARSPTRTCSSWRPRTASLPPPPSSRTSPVEVRLDGLRAVEVLGPGPDARGRAGGGRRPVLRVPPSRLRVVVAGDAATVAEWEWAKWLPHTAGMPSDAVGPVRLISASEDSVTQWLDAEPPRRGGIPCSSGTAMVSRTPTSRRASGCGGHGPGGRDVAGGGRRGLALRVGPEGGRLEATGRSDLPRSSGRTGSRSPRREAVARRLAGRQRRAAGPGRTGSGALDAPTLLGLGDVDRLDLPALWAPRPRASRLRATLGTARTPRRSSWTSKHPPRAGPVRTDCSSAPPGRASQSCSAPWCSLVAQHGPDVLNLVLVDFKGGATFAGLSELPHVSALITISPPS